MCLNWDVDVVWLCVDEGIGHQWTLSVCQHPTVILFVSPEGEFSRTLTAVSLPQFLRGNLPQWNTEARRDIDFDLDKKHIGSKLKSENGTRTAVSQHFNAVLLQLCESVIAIEG